MNCQNHTFARALVIVAALLWALAGVCVKSITWGPIPLIFARSLLALCVFGLFKRGFRIKLTKANLLGALMMTLTGFLYIIAIKMTTAGTAIVLQYIAPVWVFVYSVLFLHRKAKPFEILMIALVFGGILLCFLDSLDMTRLWGNILAVLSSFTFAGQILLMNGKDSDPLDVCEISCLMNMLISLPLIIANPDFSFTAVNLVWVCILGVLQYGLANVCYALSAKAVSPVESSLLLTLEPICNPIMVALICGETMGVRAILGAVIAIAGLSAYTVLGSQKRESK